MKRKKEGERKKGEKTERGKKGGEKKEGKKSDLEKLEPMIL